MKECMLSHKIDISVIIPLYNGEKYIGHCIESVLTQDIGKINFEVVVVNDGSIDGSADIVNKYQLIYPQTIKVIHQKNKGASEARKTGLKYAKGDYVVFLDSDDWIEKTALKKMYDRCIFNELDFLECSFVKYLSPKQSYNTKHKYVGIYTQPQFYSILFDVNEEIAVTCAMSRRELWSEDMFLPVEVRLPNEDLFPLYTLASKISRVEITNEMPIYHYRYNPNSATQTNVLIKQQDLWKDYFKILRRRLVELNLLERYEQNVRMMEVNRLAFNVERYDVEDEWFKKVLKYEIAQFDFKHKILAVLLKSPKLCRRLVELNRRLKRLISIR